MSSVKITVKTKQQAFPTGTVAGNWKFWITDAAGTIIGVAQSLPGLIATFAIPPAIPPAQVLTAHAVRLNSAGMPLGTEVKVNFSIGGTTVMVDVVDTITAEVTY